MLAIKGYYKNGRIELLEPMPEDIQTAEVVVVILSKRKNEPQTQEGDSYFEVVDVNSTLRKTRDWTDKEWNELGLRSFFETSEDDDTGVEVVFDDKK